MVENSLSRNGVETVESPWYDGTTGVHRGFDHLEFATHNPAGPLHYGKWMLENHPEAMGGFYRVLDAEFEVNADGGGATGAPQVQAEVEKALLRIRKHGKAAGILIGDLSLAKRYLDLGATFVAIGNDVTLLAGATTKLLADFKAAEPAKGMADVKVY